MTDQNFYIKIAETALLNNAKKQSRIISAENKIIDNAFKAILEHIYDNDTEKFNENIKKAVKELSLSLDDFIASYDSIILFLIRNKVQEMINETIGDEKLKNISNAIKRKIDYEKWDVNKKYPKQEVYYNVADFLKEFNKAMNIDGSLFFRGEYSDNTIRICYGQESLYKNADLSIFENDRKVDKMLNDFKAYGIKLNNVKTILDNIINNINEWLN